MGILSDLLDRVRAAQAGIEGGALVRGALVPRGGDILELQRLQLLAGQASSGEDLRPYYSEDLKPGGYFKSRESAARYAAWKQELNYPYSVRRNPDAPNLYINGKFHSELDVEFGADAVAVVPATMYAAGIMAKYGLKSFGLTLANWMTVFVERGAYEALMANIKKLIYGQ